MIYLSQYQQIHALCTGIETFSLKDYWGKKQFTTLDFDKFM